MQIFKRKNKVDELRRTVETNNKQINKRIDELFEKIESLFPDKEEIEAEPVVTEIKPVNNKRRNGSKSKKKIHKNPEARYDFPDTYAKPFNVKLFADGSVGNPRFKEGTWESYELLKIFKAAKFPILNGQYKELQRVIDSTSLSYNTGFSFLYTVQYELEIGNSNCQLLENILFPIYENEYKVPFFIDFNVKNNTIRVNDHDTGITYNMMRKFMSELSNSIHPKSTIVQLMHDNQDLNQKYLFYCLMNYGNDKLNELII